MSVDFVRGVRGNLGAHHLLISLISVVVESACPGDKSQATDGGRLLAANGPTCLPPHSA